MWLRHVPDINSASGNGVFPRHDVGRLGSNQHYIGVGNHPSFVRDMVYAFSTTVCGAANAPDSVPHIHPRRNRPTYPLTNVPESFVSQRCEDRPQSVILIMPSTISALVNLISLTFLLLQHTLALPLAISPSSPPEIQPFPRTTTTTLNILPRDPEPTDNSPSPAILATIIIISILAVLASIYFLLNYRVWIIDNAAERGRLRKRAAAVAAAQEAARAEEEFSDYIYARGWEAYQWDVYRAELEGWKRWVMQRRTKAWGWG